MKTIHQIGLTWTLLVLACGLSAKTAYAIKPFEKEFWKKYLEDNPNKDYVTLIKKKVKCNLCHDPNKRTDKGKKSKKFRNAYGTELSKLLDRKKDKKDTKKIQEALDKVAKMKSDPKDPKSPTYGDLIKQGKLPAGTPPEPTEK